jgi:Flp pilus assembly protein TadD
MAGRRISRLVAALTTVTVLSAHAAQRQENTGKGGEVTPSLQPVAAQLASAAQQALRQGDYPAAIRGFEALVKMAPRVAGFRANLVMAYYSAHAFPDAARAFEEALKLEPRLLNPHYFLGLSLSKGG